MIKMLLGNDSETVLLLGLSRENLMRLPEDQPMVVDLAELGLELRLEGKPTQGSKIIILGGETEDSIKAHLQQTFDIKDDEIRDERE